jgi:hypothetical protein
LKLNFDNIIINKRKINWIILFKKKVFFF